MNRRIVCFKSLPGLMIVTLGVQMVAGSAHADFYYTAPVPQYATPGLAKVGDNYYDGTLDGMVELCTAHPQICAPEDLQARLASLQRKRIISYSMYGAAGASFIGGLALGVKLGANGGGEAVVYSGMALSGILTLAGLAIKPGFSDVRQLVNAINDQQPETKIDWHVGVTHSESEKKIALNVTF